MLYVVACPKLIQQRLYFFSEFDPLNIGFMVVQLADLPVVHIWMEGLDELQGLGWIYNGFHEKGDIGSKTT